jgi:hypothetical protein
MGGGLQSPLAQLPRDKARTVRRAGAMIENGLYMILAEDSAIKALTGGVVDFNLLRKDATTGIVIHKITGSPLTPMEQVTDLNISRFQFDCYAGKYLDARDIARRVKFIFQDYTGTLPDGTTMTTLELNVELDAPYEIGGQGFLFRRILDFTLSYKELDS